MRIAHVTATFPPYYAGTGTVCYHNALGLARLGHDVTVFTAQYPHGEYADSEEFTVCRLPALFRIGNAPFLPGLLGLKGFDIIHLHHPFIFGAEMVWAVSKARAMPYVLTHHNDLIGDGMRRHLFDAYSAVSAKLVSGGASRFAAVSLGHAASCNLTPFFRKRWDHVVEVPNGVDTDLFHPKLDGNSVRRRHDISHCARIVLFVGVLDRAHHYKGVDYLLRVFSQVDGDNNVLMIVGDGELKDQFVNLAGQLGIAYRVCFVGAVPHSDLGPYYAAADVLVLPSFAPESFGLVLVEAMACGKPVIAHDSPGVRSVVREGVDGFLVQAGEARDLASRMKSLLEDPLQCRRMGEQGRARVENNYTWPKIVSRLVQVYEAVLTTDGSNP